MTTNSKQRTVQERNAFDEGFTQALKLLLVDLLVREGYHTPSKAAQMLGIEARFCWKAFRQLKEEGMVYELKDPPKGETGYFWYMPVIGQNAEIPPEPSNDELTEELLETIDMLIDPRINMDDKDKEDDLQDVQ